MITQKPHHLLQVFRQNDCFNSFNRRSRNLNDTFTHSLNNLVGRNIKKHL